MCPIGCASAAFLAPRYSGFTEGFESADLREARTLLDALTPFGLQPTLTNRSSERVNRQFRLAHSPA